MIVAAVVILGGSGGRDRWEVVAVGDSFLDRYRPQLDRIESDGIVLMDTQAKGGITLEETEPLLEAALADGPDAVVLSSGLNDMLALVPRYIDDPTSITPAVIEESLTEVERGLAADLDRITEAGVKAVYFVPTVATVGLVQLAGPEGVQLVETTAAQLQRRLLALAPRYEGSACPVDFIALKQAGALTYDDSDFVYPRDIGPVLDLTGDALAALRAGDPCPPPG